jgi:UDP-glucose 4-epimerase
VREGAEGKRILVTGGAGLLGVSLLRCLSQAKHPVTIIDDGSGDGLGRLTSCNSDASVRIYNVDVCDEAALAAVCAEEQPWGVVHLAGRHFIPDCEARPSETWQVNVEGTRSLLAGLAPRPPCWFLFASTADVYRESCTPHQENDPVGPQTVYGRSKLAAEQLILERLEAWPTRPVVARLFNLYGPHDSVGHLIPTVVAQAREGDLIQLGDLSTVRDYVYVDDAALALIAVMRSGRRGIHNVGTGISTSGKEVVGLVAALLGRELTVLFDPRKMRRSNRHALVADTRRLAELLPRWPMTPLVTGLQNVIRHSGGGTDPERCSVDGHAG